MKYRRLGKTRLNVSEIGFGCGNVGGLMVRGTFEEQLEAINHALELGINYFDTAESYGNGKSETNLGRVLKEIDAKVLVATKVRLSVEDLKNIKKAIQLSLESSLKRLQMDSVDVFMLHSRIAWERDGAGWRGALSVKDVLGENGVADVFEEMRTRGLFQYMGLTGLGQTEALHRIIESDRFDVIQSYFNLLNPSAGYKMPKSFDGYDFKQLIDKAVKHDVGVAAIRVMAAGAVGGEKARSGYAASSVGGSMVPGSDYEADEARTNKLDFLMEEDVTSLPQAALRFVLAHPGVSLALVGFSNITQIEEAAVCSGKGPLLESAMKELRTLWASNFSNT